VAHVLIVDDELHIREALRMLLEDAGHTVRMAPDGAAALQALRASQQPEVVLLDLLMPGMDGLEMLHQVIAEPRLASQNGYILMTADSQRLLRSAADVFNRLPVTVVRKPFDADDVLETVAAVAERLGGTGAATSALGQQSQGTGPA
jgi:CheY-like chemotaxis protein